MAAPRKLRFYVDESGDFVSVATHVVCAVVVPPQIDASEETFAALWQELGIAWRAFHATEHTPDEIARYAAHFRERLLPAGIGIVFAWHQNRRRYGHTFYVPLAARAIVTGWEQALPAQAARQPQPDSVECVATFEYRRDLNLPLLKKRLQDSCREVTRRAGACVGANFLMTVVEKGSSPLLQIADLFANAFFRARNGRGASIEAILEGLPAQHADEPWICASGQIQLEREVHGGTAPPASAPVPAAVRPVEHLRAEIILDRARTAAVHGKRLTPSDWRPAVADLMEESPASRAAEVALLLDAVPRLADEERDYDLAELVVEVTDQIVLEERKRARQGADLLDEWTARATANWVLIMNHRGRACAREPRVEEALAIAARLQRQTRHRPMTATLANYVSVNLHNALDFAEAERRLGPLADFYLDEVRAPPGVDVSEPWIGALLGTHAQTKAFAAHDRFFADRGTSLRADLAQARLFSEYATLHFSAREDLLRHATYQAHTHMQEAMLLGDPAALVAAGELLATTQTPDDAVADMTAQLPSPAAITPAYRVSALLKHAWLAKARPPWLVSLDAAVLRVLHALPSEHPYEQIAGYLALLSDGSTRARYRKTLRAPDWQGVVGLIARCFDAQVDYAEAYVVAPERLEAVRAAARLSLPPQWLCGQLEQELARFAVPRGGRPPGPLVLLPFNFS